MLFNMQSKLLYCLLFGDINQSCYQSVAFLKSLSIYRGSYISTNARCHTFVEIDHKIRSFSSRRVVSVDRESMCTKYWLTTKSSMLRKKCGKLTERLDMTIAVDWYVKPQTKQAIV